MKKIVLFLFIALSNNLYSQQWEYITIKDSLRSGDTVFLVNERTIGYINGDTFISRNAIYIEPDKSSNYHRNAICDYGLGKNYYITDAIDGGYYTNIDNHFYKEGGDEKGFYTLKEVFPILKKKKTPQNLPRKWIPLYPYNNEYYLYRPCEFIIQRYNITDTLLMYYGWMDGIYGFSYDTIVQKSKNHYQIKRIKDFHNRKINIYIIDREKGIAVFEFDNYKPRLYVDAEKVGYFPVIVHYCNGKEDNYEFSDIDLKKLIEKFKSK